MSLRDFRCTKCGRVTEHIVRASDAATRRCEEPATEYVPRLADGLATGGLCGGELEPVPGIARTSFTLKGAWFKTTGGY